MPQPARIKLRRKIESYPFEVALFTQITQNSIFLRKRLPIQISNDMSDRVGIKQWQNLQSGD